MTMTTREDSSLLLVGTAAVVIVVVLVYLTGAVTLVYSWLGLGNVTRLSVDPARLNDTQTIRIALPATNGSILIEPDIDGGLEPADGDTTLTVDDGVVSVPAADCSAGCTVDLRVMTTDPLEFDIRYGENDTEYVDDIAIDYGS